MKHTAQQALCRAVLGASALALAVLPARATLKYQPGDYAAQDALVVHLDGIANAGVGKPHDPTANVWANLANPANPAAITANARPTPAHGQTPATTSAGNPTASPPTPWKA